MAHNRDPYKDIANTYDAIMGERDEVQLLLKLVRKAHPNAKTILELGCGTGTLLKPFARQYAVSGIDTSLPMLKKARKQIPDGEFFQQDMTTFRTNKRYDVILCLFNSLNHHQRFSEWQSTFSQCKKHIEKGGIFIFDIVTPLSIKNNSNNPVRFEKQNGHTMITEFAALPNDTLKMDISVFTHIKNQTYSLKETAIIEKAYPTQKIKAELRKNFSKFRVIDPHRKKAGAYSEVLYFVCTP